MADSLTVKVQGLDQIIKRFEEIKSSIPRVVVAGINSTARHVRALATKDISDEWTIGKRTVSSTMSIRQATKNSLAAEVKMASRPIALSKFNMRKFRIAAKAGKRTARRRYGVEVQLKTAQDYKRLTGAFPATMKSGHYGAYIRKGSSRLPILEKKSITPTSMWADYIQAHLKAASPYLRARIEGQLEAALLRRTK